MKPLYTADAPPLKDGQYEEARRFALEHPRCLLMVPLAQRDQLIRDLTEDLALRRTIVLTYRKHARHYPWAMYVNNAHQLSVQRRFIERYIIAGPRVPLRISHWQIERVYDWVKDYVDLFVGDSSEMWMPRNFYRKTLMMLDADRKIAFTGNPFRTPGSLCQQLRWIAEDQRYFRRNFYDSFIDNSDVSRLEYRNLGELIELINSQCYPPLTPEQVAAWLVEWKARRELWLRDYQSLTLRPVIRLGPRQGVRRGADEL